MVDKFGVLKYSKFPEYNLGDYVQSFAAKQYLPQIDNWILREGLADYEGEEIKMILNGWFMSKPNWPPSKNIIPLYVSFHLNPSVADIILKSPGSVEHFKKNGPIGCRDFYTLSKMQEYGIDSYFSSCLTTTLDISYGYKNQNRTDEIIFSDVLFNVPGPRNNFRTFREFLKSIYKKTIFQSKKRNRILNKIFDEDLLKNAVDLSHKFSNFEKEEKRLERTDEFLTRLSRAKMVFTSRIHCALPCLAMGTPVIFINNGFVEHWDNSRFGGLMDLFNYITVDDEENIYPSFNLSGKIDMDFIIENKKEYQIHAEKLKKKCFDFIKN